MSVYVCCVWEERGASAWMCVIEAIWKGRVWFALNCVWGMACPVPPRLWGWCCNPGWLEGALLPINGHCDSLCWGSNGGQFLSQPCSCYSRLNWRFHNCFQKNNYTSGFSPQCLIRWFNSERAISCQSLLLFLLFMMIVVRTEWNESISSSYCNRFAW